MPDNLKFDAHCHLLTTTYLQEALQEIRGRQRPAKPLYKEYRTALPAAKEKFDPFTDFIRWLEEFIKILKAGTTEEVYNILMAKEPSGWGEQSMKIIPLMMDIVYFFDEPLLPGKNPSSEKKPNNSPHPPSSFDNELAEMVALQRKYPAKIYPFLAVDPRRDGIFELMKTVVSKQGPFYGVKLYPLLGYHPQCEELQQVYAYCNENNFPITVHASLFGFGPVWKIKQMEFGRPENYAVILKQYKNLRINFAHFGHNALSLCIWKNWAKQIVKLYKQYPAQVFTDVSCYTEDKTLSGSVPAMKILTNSILTRLQLGMSQSAIITMLNSIFMYGTDFDVMFFTGVMSLEMYVQEFKAAFMKKYKEKAQEIISNMTRTTPQRFLALEKSTSTTRGVVS